MDLTLHLASPFLESLQEDNAWNKVINYCICIQTQWNPKQALGTWAGAKQHLFLHTAHLRALLLPSFSPQGEGVAQISIAAGITKKLLLAAAQSGHGVNTKVMTEEPHSAGPEQILSIETQAQRETWKGEKEAFDLSCCIGA